MSNPPSFQGFVLSRLLGVGATAEVFAAKNVSDNRSVALKVFSPIVSRDQELVERLQAEAEILERLRHPNVVATYGVQNHDGQFAIELELIEGFDLRKWMDTYRSSLPFSEVAMWIIAQISRGLGAAHEIGALHRDLKPENILISNNGDVKITDFGLARTVTRVTMTRVGLLVGSLGYLAPEVVNGERATPQSDLFSLGVMSYELLVGRPPFIGETPQALIQKLTLGQFTSTCEAAPHLPEDVGRIVDACLAREPAARPRSVWEVEAAFMTTLSNGPLLRFAKPLLAASLDVSDNEELVASSLRAKHEWLLTYAKPENRSWFLTEFHRLFPQDAAIAELIQKTSPHEPASNRRRLLLTAALAAGLGGVTLLNLERCNHESRSAVQTPIHADVSAIESEKPAVSLAAPAPTPSPRPKSKEKPATHPFETNGTLTFEVPDDVNVYVADVLVPRAELSSYKIAAGRYPMRMVKDGFLPIESTVDVKAGRVAVIRAGGLQ